MIKKSFNASLVGIKYHQTPFDVYDTIKSTSILLRRDKNNQHDSNAVEVVLKGYRVGFIDRESASVLSHLLDQGYSYEAAPNKIDKNLKSIKLDIKFFITENNSVARPNLSSSAGIYEISVNKKEFVYVGQAINIQNRISNHWSELQFNNHANKSLQNLWNEKGPLLFEASVIELAPETITSELERQRWLAERERYWISNSRKNHNSLNITDGELVPTRKAIEEFEREEKQFIKEHNERVREKKESLKLKINEAEAIYRDHYKRVKELEINLKEGASLVRMNTGLMGFLTGYKQRPEALKIKPQLSVIFGELEKEKILMQDAYAVYSSLQNDYSKLKTHAQLDRELDKLAHRMGTFRNKKKIW